MTFRTLHAVCCEVRNIDIAAFQAFIVSLILMSVKQKVFSLFWSFFRV